MSRPSLCHFGYSLRSEDSTTSAGGLVSASTAASADPVPSVRGQLCLSLSYNSVNTTLTVTVIGGQDLTTVTSAPSEEDHELERAVHEVPSVYVKLAVLPRRRCVPPEE